MWSYRGCHEPHRGHCCGGGHGPSGPANYWPPYPGWYAPWFFAGPEPERSTEVPMEIAADTANPSKQALVGGERKVHLQLEYSPDTGATSPSVKVTITDSTGDAAFNITSVPAGYNVKRDFACAAPGATVKLDVSACSAHLRWFETVS